MNRGFLKELRVTRRAFATLATVLLLLPLIFGLLPQPSISSADNIASLTGNSICSRYADPLGDHNGKQNKDWPCQNCLPGSMAIATGAAPETVILAFLVPRTDRAYLSSTETTHLRSQVASANNPARAPPVIL